MSSPSGSGVATSISVPPSTHLIRCTTSMYFNVGESDIAKVAEGKWAPRYDAEIIDMTSVEEAIIMEVQSD